MFESTERRVFTKVFISTSDNAYEEVTDLCVRASIKSGSVLEVGSGETGGDTAVISAEVTLRSDSDFGRLYTMDFDSTWNKSLNRGLGLNGVMANVTPYNANVTFTANMTGQFQPGDYIRLLGITDNVLYLAYFARVVFQNTGTTITVEWIGDQPNSGYSYNFKMTGGNYVPLLFPGKKIVIRTAVMNDTNAAPGVNDWYSVFEGYLGDNISTDAFGNSIDLSCRDNSQILMDRYITEVRYYGTPDASSTTSNLYQVLKKILSDNGLPDSIEIPSGEPEFTCFEYPVEYQSVWDALHEAVKAVGWFIGYRRYSPTEWRLTLIDPGRYIDNPDSRPQAEDVIYASDLYSNPVSFNNREIRNAVTIAYVDKLDKKKTILKPYAPPAGASDPLETDDAIIKFNIPGLRDLNSIAVYGERPMGIELAETSLVDTETEALALVKVLLHDVSDMVTSYDVEVPLYPQASVYRTYEVLNTVRDNIRLTGTVSIANNTGSVIGVGTKFSTELKYHKVLIVNGIRYTVLGVSNDTYATISPYVTSSVVNARAYTGILMAVHSYAHTIDFGGKKFRTELIGTSRVVGQKQKWLNMQTRPGAGRPLSGTGTTSGVIFPKVTNIVVTSAVDSAMQTTSSRITITWDPLVSKYGKYYKVEIKPSRKLLGVDDYVATDWVTDRDLVTTYIQRENKLVTVRQYGDYTERFFDVRIAGMSQEHLIGEWEEENDNEVERDIIPPPKPTVLYHVGVAGGHIITLKQFKLFQNEIPLFNGAYAEYVPDFDRFELYLSNNDDYSYWDMATERNTDINRDMELSAYRLNEKQEPLVWTADETEEGVFLLNYIFYSAAQVDIAVAYGQLASIGKQTVHNMFNLQLGTEYSCKIVAVDTSGNRSDYTEVRFTPGSGEEIFSCDPNSYIDKYDAVWLTATGQLAAASYDNVNIVGKIVGFALNDAGPNEPVSIQRSGVIENPAWDLYTGLGVYCGLNGSVMSCVPPVTQSGSNVEVKLGSVKTYTSIEIKIGSYILK